MQPKWGRINSHSYIKQAASRCHVVSILHSLDALDSVQATQQEGVLVQASWSSFIGLRALHTALLHLKPASMHIICQSKSVQTESIGCDAKQSVQVLVNNTSESCCRRAMDSKFTDLQMAEAAAPHTPPGVPAGLFCALNADHT